MLTDFFSGNDGNNLLGILVGALIGFVSSIAVELIRRKTKKEQKIDEYESINESAERSVKSAQIVSSMLEERLVKEREYLEEALKHSKEDCQRQIANMKIQYDFDIKDLQDSLLEKEKEISSLREILSHLTEEKQQEK